MMMIVNAAARRHIIITATQQHHKLRLFHATLLSQQPRSLLGSNIVSKALFCIQMELNAVQGEHCEQLNGFVLFN